MQLNPGDRVGNYQLVRLLGTGGMGAVYLAERTDDMKMRVALKVLTRHENSHAAQRFLRERQLLARLKHPNIAQIIDGGISQDQQLWFAMELVEGQTLDCYLAEQKPNLNQKLKLFLKICEAVSFAHQNLIIHRDLKPTNIMVDRKGEPKLLDFGVAGIVDPEGQDTQTLIERAFTPQYASPEQILGEPLTATTDVYALGLIFYELISDLQPYVLLGQPPKVAVDLICQKPVTKPSDALTTGSTSDLQTLRGKLRGDLDTIALKALAKSSGDRYASVEQFSQDVFRYLNSQPISARQPTLAYRTVKLAQRYRTALIFVSILFAVLVSALFYSVEQQRLAEIERQKAVVEAEKAKSQQAIAEKGIDFLGNLLQQMGPGFQSQNKMSVFRVLEKATEYIEVHFSENPDVQISLYSQVILAYRTLGDGASAERVLNKIDIEHLKESGFRNKRDLAFQLMSEYRASGQYERMQEIFSLLDVDDVAELNNRELSSYVELLQYIDDPELIDHVQIEKAINQKGRPLDPKYFYYSYKALRGDLDQGFYQDVFDENGFLSMFDIKGLCDPLFYYSGLIMSILKDVDDYEYMMCYFDATYRTLLECSKGSYHQLMHRNYFYRYISYALTAMHAENDVFDTNQFFLSQDESDYLSTIGLSANFYFSSILANSEVDRLPRLWHTLDRMTQSYTIMNMHDPVHDFVIAYGWSTYFHLNQDFEREITLLADVLNSQSWDKGMGYPLRTYLARAYFAAGKKAEGLSTLKALKQDLKSAPLDEPEHHWEWMEIANDLFETHLEPDA